MSQLRDAMVAHWTQLKELSGETVTYSRHGKSDKTLTMVPGLQQIRLETVQGVSFSRKESDFLISVEEFTATGLEKPKLRDKITTSLGGITRKFEVRQMIDEREYDVMDQFGVMIRVH